jgi:hypothetical protein
MVALIFDSPVFTHISNGSGERCAHRLVPVGAGDTSVDKLVDAASRLTIKGTLDATFIAAETTRAAVLFADMRGYMGLAERLPLRESHLCSTISSPFSRKSRLSLVAKCSTWPVTE